MTSDTPAPVPGPARRWPQWAWVLAAVCAVVGVGLVVAVTGLFMAPSPAPGPGPGASPSPSPTPSSPTGTPTARTDLSAYRLSDPLPFTAPPVWHAEPSARYRLTAAPDELRYVAENRCTLVFRSEPYTPGGRTTAPGPGAAGGSPTAGATASDPALDAETAATMEALAAAIDGIRAEAAQAAVTEERMTVVSTLGSLSGPLVDMAAAALRVTQTDGTVVHVRLAVRAVPGAGTAMVMSAECPSAEEAATGMNHASVHAFIAAQ
ncbi:hypothetical protein [Sinomonas mesophila]|uniref:hypothetical protein n=1 Tax=Sinomonas mesophila TaxID=1531955 RepID=UPI00098616CB|nr:hypothetical protein [Sinomonas mesophila]